jgi:hypothetical protein
VTDYKTQRLDADDGLYYRSLKFYNTAFQMGMVDPDSPSNTWNSYCEKIRDGQILSGIWPWAVISNYNTAERVNADEPKGFEFVPVADGKYFARGYNPTCQWGNNIGLGAKAPQPERLFEMLDWTASPEGCAIIQSGIPGLQYDLDENGMPYLTDLGLRANEPDLQIPAEFGGGKFSDIHWGLIEGRFPHDINPDWGVPFSSMFWPSEIERNRNKLNADWQQTIGAEHMVDYLKKNGMYVVTPGSSYQKEDDILDIETARTMCGQIVANMSWQMVFAASDAELARMWEEMKSQLQEAGWEDVVAVDLACSRDFADSCLLVIEQSK